MNEQWSSRLNFIWAATGAAVGLGAIWKFPYMAGDNGGGAFVLLFVLSILFISLPIMMAEILLGKLGNGNAIYSLTRLSKQYKQSPYWKLLGWVGCITLVFILSFYSVVAGWSIGYFFKAITGSFTNSSPEQIANEWQNFLHNPYALLILHTIFLFLTLWITALGIKRGLERISNIATPGLLLIILILITYNIFVGDINTTVKFLLEPNFNAINTYVAINALGQALFSLAVGAGCMLIYGCYMPKNTHIATSAVIVTILTTTVTLLAGFTVFPIVFAYNLSPESGPGLMFKVLPIAFGKMPAGQFLGALFFLLLWSAAWTSSISLAEPIVATITKEFKLNRIKASFIVGIITWVIGGVTLLSFNILSDIKIFSYDIFTFITTVTNNICLPIGALGFAIFVGWKLPITTTQKELHIQNKLIFKIWLFLIRYIAPTSICILLIL